MSEAKGLFCSRRKKYSGSNSQESSILTLDQPPRPGKRALLCCVSYKKQKSELKGTEHDLKNMRDLLIKKFDFRPESILILAEKRPYPYPTKENIEKAFQWLMMGIQPGDSLVFYFSGHGLRQLCTDGSEVDGFDEAICPVDFETHGTILDNDINETIVRPLIQGVTLHAIVDSCHSGTALDLPYVYDISTGKWDDHRPPSGEPKGTSGGKAICISACEDYQLAADTSAFSADKDSAGAMTSVFIKAVKTEEKITYREILNRMDESLKKVDNVGCFRGFIRRFFHRRILQDPILSASEEIDLDADFKL
ncbi:Metacaspase involved in regulation of apoptosis [Handroanthus impetiginosus]|uniref:Metacaspase involved in regulation of apoptosis n=1 Tax=Handroanthus impetiginosus TaxID=429701 RepID=A0A2G9H0D4_9LAMI|nr:Metacaspase involved in regulation of apoptosis [Handroanthus impetiginosus]